MKKFALAAAVVAFSSTSAMAATTPVNTIQGSVSVSIAPTIQLSHSGALNFGTIVETGTAAGSVTIAPIVGATSTTPASITNSNNLKSVSGAAFDSFTVTGSGNATYTVTLPAATANITITPNLSVNGLVTSLPVTNGTPVGTLTNGTSTFYVGGKLNWTGTAVDAYSTSPYTGSYSVTVNYN